MISEQAVQLGGAVVIALALVEVIKIIIIKLLNGNGSGVNPTTFANEVAWRTEIGGIVREQHKIQKSLFELLREHHNESQLARKKLDKIHEDLQEIQEQVVT